MTLERYSERYSATGGLAAVGVLNQLGRPDIEPLEVLVREAVQNCWDARRPTSGSIRVEIGRDVLDADAAQALRDELLVNPPPGLPLGEELVPGMETLFFADFGTDGLRGPTRADEPGAQRDFVDFVRNIGQPPDKDLGAGSFGYGKAAFYIASRARTIIVDTLCIGSRGTPERRVIGCALGDNFDDESGRPHTGRHWWGRIVNGVPEPLTDEAAERAAGLLNLPERRGDAGFGTTIVIVAPGVAPESDDGTDQTMAFIADALAWNFWPRMISTPGAGTHTMEFGLRDRDLRVKIPNPRTHHRLRGFVEAMDRLREEPGEDSDFVLDRSIESFRPVQRLGRLVVQKGPVAPADVPARAVPQGARMTADSVHHVALMRNAELIVKYLPGAIPVTGRMGYSGVFKCAVGVDEAFRRAEPPTHDDWIPRAITKGRERSFVKIALERVNDVCREAAGYDASIQAGSDGAGVPLGEFADAMAALMPGFSGPGARRQSVPAAKRPRRRKAPGNITIHEDTADVWVDGIARTGEDKGDSSSDTSASVAGAAQARPPRAPQVRPSGDPSPDIAADGTAVVRYPFELRGHGSRIRLGASVEVMANDGGQVESEAPLGSTAPTVHAWVDPSGAIHRTPTVESGPDGIDGMWVVEVTLTDELMMRVDISPEIA